MNDYPLPPPPLDSDGDLRIFYWDIVGSLEHGRLGGCVACHSSSVTWWGLEACAMPPVTDRHGHLNDYAPLHERCVLAVLDAWAILLHGDPGEDETPEPFTGVARNPPLDHDRAPRRSPQGAYARRGATT